MNKKKNKIIFMIIAVVIVVVSLIVFNFYYRKLNYINNLNIKIGEELPTVKDYIDSKDLKWINNTQIEWENINLKDNKIYYAGKYTGYITFKNKKIKINVEVIDDEKPTIEGVKDINIYLDEEVDFFTNITTSDNSYDEVSLNVNGEYNTSKVGEYLLSYVATDKSGNETIKKFKLIVKDFLQVFPNTGISENINVGTTSKGYTIKRINGIYYINDLLIANKTYALPSSYAPGSLLNTFMDAFYNMQSAATNEGISLSIISGYRSYTTQQNLYQNYVNRDGKALADTYSARAGHSEHQTGLAADINSLDQGFINTFEGKWLNDNCYKYGFIIRYPKGKENITGYMYEPWHIRYVGIEMATSLYNNGNWISLEEYLGIISKYD